MLRVKLPVILAFILLGPTSTAWSGDQLPPAKKLIEWGWDEPNTKFIQANIEQMEQFPFRWIGVPQIGAEENPFGTSAKENMGLSIRSLIRQPGPFTSRT